METSSKVIVEVPEIPLKQNDIHKRRFLPNFSSKPLSTNIQKEAMKYKHDTLYQPQVVIVKYSINPFPTDLEWFLQSDADYFDGLVIVEKDYLYVIFNRYATISQSDLIIAKQQKCLGQHLYEEINHTCFKHYYIDEYLSRAKQWYIDNPNFQAETVKIDTEDIEGEEFTYTLIPIQTWISRENITINKICTKDDYDYQEVPMYQSIYLIISNNGKKLKSTYKDFSLVFPMHHKTTKINWTFIYQLIETYHLEIDNMNFAVSDNKLVISVEVTDTNISDKYSWKFKWI